MTNNTYDCLAVTQTAKFGVVVNEDHSQLIRYTGYLNFIK